MITSFDSTKCASKTERLASDIEDADQSADDSVNDLQLADAASSSKQGGVKSRGFELPPGGPSVWIVPTAPLPPNVPVLESTSMPSLWR